MDKHPAEGWYRLGYRRAVDGQRAVRTWHIPCSRCDQVLEITPGSSTDEGVRKGLLKKGWYIGRHINQHCCPACRAPKRPEPDVPVVAVAELPVTEDKTFLMECWDSCTEEERQAFLKQIAPAAQPPLPWHAGIAGAYISYWEGQGVMLPLGDVNSMIGRITSAYVNILNQNTELVRQLKERPQETIRLVEKNQSLLEHWNAAAEGERTRIWQHIINANNASTVQNGFDYIQLVKAGIFKNRDQLYRAIAHQNFPTPTRVSRKDIWDRAEVEAWAAKQQAIEAEIDKYRHGVPRASDDEIVPNWDDDDIAAMARKIG
jgi:hypothetical protein